MFKMLFFAFTVLGIFNFATAQTNFGSTSGLTGVPPLKPELQAQPLANPLVNPRLISVTVITAEDISRYCPGCDFTDILERAGVNVRRFHGNFYESSDTDTVYVDVRGVSDAQTAFFINDIRVRDAMLGEPEWIFVSVDNIERIEIVRGPKTGGDTDIGGAIKVYTKKPVCEKGKVCSQLKVSHSNKPTTGKSVSVSLSKRTEHSGFIVGAQGDRSKDLHDTPNDGDKSRYKEQDLHLGFDHSTMDNKWLFEGQAVLYNSQNTGEEIPYVERGSSDTLSLGSTYYIDPNLLFKALVGYNGESQTYDDRTHSKYTSRRISISLFSEYEFEFANGAYKLKTGVEKHRERIYAPPGIYDLDQRHTVAGFSSLTGKRGPFDYQIAVRGDRLSGDIDKKVWTWNGAVSYHLARVHSHDVFVKSGVGTGFRAPGFDEQFFVYWVRRGKYENNPDLDIEKSLTYEVGLRLERAGLNEFSKAPYYFLDITGFNTKLKDPVIYVSRYEENEDGPPTRVFSLDQVEDARVQGVEFQTGFNLKPCRGMGQYTVTDSDDAERIRGHNPLREMGSLSVDCLINPQWSVGANVTYRGDREDTVLHYDRVSVWDLNLTWTPKPHKKDLKLQLAVRNLTDKEYDLYYSTDGPPRTLWLILSTPLF